MMRQRRGINAGIALLIVLSLLSFSPGATVAAGTLELVSVATDGNVGNGQSGGGAVSGDGRYVAFLSEASNLVANDTNGFPDAFVRDLDTGTTELVSLSSSGAQGNGDSQNFTAISSDGRYVAFVSNATNLVANDTNEAPDIFVRDRNTGTTTVISVSSSGDRSNGQSFEPSISADGRYVAFSSEADNLVANDTNEAFDVFVHDRVTGETERVSVADSTGAQADFGSLGPSINADGRYVAFASGATNLVPPHFTTEIQIFVHDRDTGATVLASRNSSGEPGDDESRTPAISGNGRYVAMTSEATNLVAGITDSFPQYIYVHDLSAGTMEIASLELGGAPARGSLSPSISFDGRYVAYDSIDDDIVLEETPGGFNVYVYDRIGKTTELVSITPAGIGGNNQSNSPSISVDGNVVAFQSLASDLAVNDPNGALDVFAWNRELADPTPVVNAGDDDEIVQDQTFSQSGVFTDPDSSSWTATVDYGEGEGPQPLTLNGDQTFDLSNLYEDPGLYTITVEVCDAEDNCGSDTVEVRVFDVPLTVIASDETGAVGQQIVFDASFTDPDELDSHTATIDPGDGSGPQPATVIQDTDDVTGSHTYTQSGFFTGEVCVQDNAGLEDCDTFSANIAGDAPVVDAGPDATADEGVEFMQSGSFTDPDSSEWTADVDYGDGHGDEALPLNADQTFDLSHFYLDNGIYTVEVCVFDGSETGCDQLEVTVANVTPSVDAGPDQNAQVGETVNLAPTTFSDSGTADTHTATIDWGDGSAVETSSVALGVRSVPGSHSYSQSGDFTVEVCVTDDDGAEDCDSFEVTVTDAPANQPPIVVLGEYDAINEGDTLTGTEAFTDPDSSSWTATVDYGAGDGPQPLALNGDQSFSLDHTYQDNGDYTVTVEVCDEDGCGSDTVVLRVFNLDPAVTAGSHQTATVGQSVSLSPATFTDPGAADTHTATIDWGDGSAIENGVVNQADLTVGGSHSYSTTGEHTVEICVTDDDEGEGCDGFLVTVGEAPVNQPPTVDNGDAEALTDEGALVTRNGSFSDQDSSSWTATVDYGDGDGEQNLTLAGMGYSLNHTYTDDGVYTLEVCVTDDENAEGCDSIPVTVNNVAPTVDAGDDQTAEAGETVTLDPASFSDPGTADIHSASIDWGDGSSSENGVVNQDANTVSGAHSYSATGEYTVEVCVKDDDDAEDCDSFVVTVTEPPSNEPPTADAGGPYSVSEGGSVLLSGSGSDLESGALTFAWDLDNNGDFGTDGQSAAFSAADRDGPDSQTVVFQVCDSANQCDTDQTTVTITNVAPAVDAGNDQAVSVGETVSLDPASFGDPGTGDNHSASIDWGDGSAEESGDVNQTANTANGSHSYSAAGSYSVEVCVTDDDEDEDCDSFKVSVTDPSGESQQLCANWRTGLIRMPDGECGRSEVALDLPEDLPLTLCARRFSGILRYSVSGACGWFERRFDLPEDGPIDVCVSPLFSIARYVSTPARCAWYEEHQVIGRLT